MLVCKICDREFPEGIPSNAVLLNTHAGINVYKWDGVIHLLYERRLNLKATHNREHKLFKQKDCPFCFPPPPTSDPIVAVEQSTPAPPIMEEVLPQAEPDGETEPEPVPLTSMAAAFRRFKS